MSLKDLTSEKHKEAESTVFMKSIFKGNLPLELWADWTYQKILFYTVIENLANKHNLLDNCRDIQRSFLIYQDYREMSNNYPNEYKYRQPVIDYHNYLLSIGDDQDKVMAHLYTWHMGDLYGGQMIKKIIKSPHRSLDFKDADVLKSAVRSKLKDTMADEANIAFDWAIKMMRDYDTYLEKC
jgi:heme oxygenase